MPTVICRQRNMMLYEGVVMEDRQRPEQKSVLDHAFLTNHKIIQDPFDR